MSIINYDIKGRPTPTLIFFCLGPPIYFLFFVGRPCGVLLDHKQDNFYLLYSK